MSHTNPAVGRKLFDTHHPLVEELIRYLAWRHHMDTEEREEFTSYAMLKLVENGYARLRKYRGKASVKTYLSVVLQRLFLDYRTHKCGKWRPSTRAVRLGTLAVRLEALLYRDRHDFQEIREMLGADVDPEVLWALASRLPWRERPRLQGEDALRDVPARGTEDALEQHEKADCIRRLGRSLLQASLELGGEDRLILQMRYGEGMSVGQVAAALHLPPKALYARISRLMKRLRRKLESRGMGWDAVSEVVGRRDLDLNLEAVFDEPSNCPPAFV